MVCPADGSSPRPRSAAPRSASATYPRAAPGPAPRARWTGSSPRPRCRPAGACDEAETLHRRQRGLPADGFAPRPECRARRGPATAPRAAPGRATSVPPTASSRDHDLPRGGRQMRRGGELHRRPLRPVQPTGSSPQRRNADPTDRQCDEPDPCTGTGPACPDARLRRHLVRRRKVLHRDRPLHERRVRRHRQPLPRQQRLHAGQVRRVHRQMRSSTRCATTTTTARTTTTTAARRGGLRPQRRQAKTATTTTPATTTKTSSRRSCVLKTTGGGKTYHGSEFGFNAKGVIGSWANGQFNYRGGNVRIKARVSRILDAYDTPNGGVDEVRSHHEQRDDGTT